MDIASFGRSPPEESVQEPSEDLSIDPFAPSPVGAAPQARRKRTSQIKITVISPEQIRRGKNEKKWAKQKTLTVRDLKEWMIEWGLVIEDAEKILKMPVADVLRRRTGRLGMKLSEALKEARTKDKKKILGELGLL